MFNDYRLTMNEDENYAAELRAIGRWLLAIG
jgi:hypothetical protein